MSRLLQEKVAKFNQIFSHFTMQSQAFIFHLYATDGDFKLPYQCLTMMAKHQLPTPDVIVVLTGAFEGVENYANLATVELCKAYDALEPNLPIGKDLALWQPDFLLENKSETAVERFCRLVKEFVEFHSAYFDKLVLFFIPPTIDSQSDWIGFIQHVFPFVNNKIRLGFIENLTPFANIQTALDLKESQLYRHVFKGDIFDIMLDVLNTYEPKDEIVDYRRYLVLAFQAQQKNAHQQTLENTQQALNIANKLNVKEMQVVTHTVMYATFVSMTDYQQAQAQAQQAVDIAKQITKEQLTSRDALEAMSLANLATAALLNKAYSFAADTYKDSAELFFTCQNWMMAYENFRMSVLCFTQENQQDRAWIQGQNAIVAFYQTPEALWKQSTLTYLAKNMQQLLPVQDKKETFVFQAHMSDLLGEYWQKEVDLLPSVSLPSRS